MPYVFIDPRHSSQALQALQFAGFRPGFDFVINGMTGAIEIPPNDWRVPTLLGQLGMPYRFAPSMPVAPTPYSPAPPPVSSYQPSPFPAPGPPQPYYPSYPVVPTPTPPPAQTPSQDPFDIFLTPSRPQQTPPVSTPTASQPPTADLLDLFGPPRTPAPSPVSTSTSSKPVFDPFGLNDSPQPTPQVRPAAVSPPSTPQTAELLGLFGPPSPLPPPQPTLSSSPMQAPSPVATSTKTSSFNATLTTSVCPQPAPPRVQPTPPRVSPAPPRVQPTPPLVSLAPPPGPGLGYTGTKEKTLLDWAGRFYDAMQLPGAKEPAHLAYNLYGFGKPEATKSTRTDSPVPDFSYRTEGGFNHIDNPNSVESGSHRRLGVRVAPTEIVAVTAHLRRLFPGTLRMVRNIKYPVDQRVLADRLDNLVIYYYDNGNPAASRAALSDALHAVHGSLVPGHPPALEEVSPSVVAATGLDSAGWDISNTLAELYGDGTTRSFLSKKKLTKEEFIGRVRDNAAKFG